MKQHFIIVFALVLAACTPGGDEQRATESAASQMTREEFDGYVNALKAHDYAGFASYYTDDFKAHIYSPQSPSGETLDSTGAQELERNLAEHWNWTLDVHQVVIDGAGIAVRATMRGPLLKPFPDSPPDGLKAGDEMVGGFASFYRLRGNKIAELWVVSNRW